MNAETHIPAQDALDEKPLVVLIDVYNLMYRLFHTRPPFTMPNSEQRLEVVKGVLNTVRGIIKNTPLGKAGRVVAVSDSSGISHRHYIHDSYKAKREGMPEELKSQRAIIKHVLDAIGVPFIEKGEVEADDLIGMLTSHYVKLGCRVLIHTTDKDMLQLVNEDVLVFNPAKKILMREAEVVEKLGVTPDLVASLLAIMGDGVDGINGIDGVGVAKAAKLLNTYGSMQGIMLSANEITGVLGEKVRANLFRVAQNVSLTVICTNDALLDERLVAYADNHIHNPEKCQKIHATYPPLNLI